MTSNLPAVPAGVLLLGAMILALPAPARAQGPLSTAVDRQVEAVMPKVVAWRRDIHEHPELGNREFRTAKLVAEHLRALGIEVRTEVGHTGVVGVLKGGRPGRVVALRADMDALPVTEQVDLPFRSVVRTIFNGQEVGVMHACGHDNHVAILMGVAEVLSKVKDQLPGTVKFIFQPAEEGPPAGEEGGAALMLKEGAFENPRPNAVFGLHVWPNEVGTIGYRSGPLMAAADGLDIVVKGRQTHGAQPWGGIDPIVISSQIVLALQTIASRQVDVTNVPVIITVGMFQSGNRGNIIPDSVVMQGTVRTFDETIRQDVHDRIRRTVESIAASAGATATVSFGSAGAVTYNDPALTEQMLPTLQRVAGIDRVNVAPLSTPAEDFAAFQKVVPGVFFFLGVTPKGVDLKTVSRNHSPFFFADEAALPVGVKALAHLAVDYLSQGSTP